MRWRGMGWWGSSHGAEDFSCARNWQGDEGQDDGGEEGLEAMGEVETGWLAK